MAPAQTFLNTANAFTNPVKEHFTFSIEEVEATERVPAHLVVKGNCLFCDHFTSRRRQT